jgi:hypothetical protein
MNINVDKINLNLGNAGKAGAAVLVPAATVIVAIFEPGRPGRDQCGCGGAGAAHRMDAVPGRNGRLARPDAVRPPAVSSTRRATRNRTGNPACAPDG